MPRDSEGADDDLVAAARAGEPDAWRRLYRLHAQRLLLWLRTIPPLDPATAHEDVAAEAWTTAAARIADFTGDADAFAGWLFTIARNHVANSRRKAARRRTDPVDVQAAHDDAFGSVDDHHAVEEEHGVRDLLAHLSPREAEVVACIDVVGLDVAATAAVLGMRPTAVRVARHRALGRLRRVLAEGGAQPS